MTNELLKWLQEDVLAIGAAAAYLHGEIVNTKPEHQAAMDRVTKAVGTILITLERSMTKRSR